MWNLKDYIADTVYLHIIPGKIVLKTISKISSFKINQLVWKYSHLEGIAVIHEVAQSDIYSLLGQG